MIGKKSEFVSLMWYAKQYSCVTCISITVKILNTRCFFVGNDFG